MSRVFYDKYLVLTSIEETIRVAAQTADEKEELWNLVDEIVNDRLISCLLGQLPCHCHEEFLLKFKSEPDSDDLLIYLQEKSGKNIEELIISELKLLTAELEEELKIKAKTVSEGKLKSKHG